MVFVISGQNSLTVYNALPNGVVPRPAVAAGEDGWICLGAEIFPAPGRLGDGLAGDRTIGCCLLYTSRCV